MPTCGTTPLRPPAQRKERPVEIEARDPASAGSTRVSANGAVRLAPRTSPTTPTTSTGMWQQLPRFPVRVAKRLPLQPTRRPRRARRSAQTPLLPDGPRPGPTNHRPAWKGMAIALKYLAVDRAQPERLLRVRQAVGVRFSPGPASRTAAARSKARRRRRRAPSRCHRARRSGTPGVSRRISGRRHTDRHRHDAGCLEAALGAPHLLKAPEQQGADDQTRHAQRHLAPTRRLRRRLAPGPLEAVRESIRMPSCGSVRAAHHAGPTPNNTAFTTTVTIVNIRTRVSSRMSSTRGRSAGAKARITVSSAYAPAIPRAPLTADSVRLSNRSWRAILIWLAPRAALTASSRRRRAARARSRFATLRT